jgi:hypothetical protein
MAIETGDKITRKYSNFRGVDFRGDECDPNRSPDALNMWRNYKKLACVETRPGVDHIHYHEHGVRSMAWMNGKLHYLTTSGDVIRVVREGVYEFPSIHVGMNGSLFLFGGDLYALGEDDFYNITKGESVLGDEAKNKHPYIPTTSTQRNPDGSGGRTYQDVNMLSPYRINSFVGDGKSSRFVLDANDLDDPPENFDSSNMSDYVTAKVVVDGIERDWTKKIATYAWVAGFVTFTEAPPEPLSAGQDNVFITFKKTKTVTADKILKCTIVQEFDNRLFLSGNPQYPGTIWHSGLNDPSYFSDLDYYIDGVDNAPVRSMVAGNNGLWVFKSGSNNGVYYHTPTLDDTYGKVYPSYHSSISLACVGRAINFNDDIVFFSDRGMEGASTDITSEQFATHRSSLIDRKMLALEGYEDMVLTEWEGYLVVFIDNEVFLADSRAIASIENHAEYEWYHWTLPTHKVTCATAHGGDLYIGTEGELTGEPDNRIPSGHIYKISVNKAVNGRSATVTPVDVISAGDELSIDSYWITPKDRLGAQNKHKTTNKKGCVVEALGDVDLYVKVDDDEFEHIGKYENVTDYFVSRIKRKKFKDIQLKFQSNTEFSIQSATLECFIGGYIKR